MKNLILMLFVVTLLFSCKKESNDTSSQNATSGQMIFYVNDLKKVCDNSTVSISENIGHNGYGLNLNGFHNIANPSSIETVKIDIYKIDFKPKNYEILNYFTSGFEYNTFSYLNGSNINNVFNNLSCDKSIQGTTSHFGKSGNLNITSINETNKTISGNFEMQLCSKDKRNVNVRGNFKDLPYTKN